MARSDREALAPPLPRPSFTEPIPGTWLYLGLAVDPRTIGPRVRHSAERARVIARCHALLDDVGGSDRGGLAGATVFETVLIPPISGIRGSTWWCSPAPASRRTMARPSRRSGPGSRPTAFPWCAR